MHALLTAPVLAADPQSTVSVTGEVTFQGKLLVACSAANPISKPSAPNPPGWQFRGGSAGREKTGQFVRLNFHNGTAKVEGPQDTSKSGVTVSLEFSPKDNAPFTSYFGIPGKVKVSLGKDFKTATVEGPFSSAISDDPVVTVKASVVCQ